MNHVVEVLEDALSRAQEGVKICDAMIALAAKNMTEASTKRSVMLNRASELRQALDNMQPSPPNTAALVESEVAK